MSAHKKNAAKKDIYRLFKVFGLSLLIVLFFIAAVSFIAHYTDWDLFGGEKQQSGSAEELICKIDADSVKMLKPYGGGVVMLTNTAVQYLDSAGREISANDHAFASPEMQLSDKTVFVYDKGGTGCRLEKNASVYREMTAPGLITCGAVGKRNNYAYALDNHEGYQSHIFVYSFKGEKQFEWGSASDYCFKMALSDFGNRLAVCVVGVENAEYYSKVMLFSFNSGQPAYTVDFSGKTVFDIDFITGRKIAVYTDGGVFIIDPDGQYTEQQAYTASELSHSCVNAHGLSATAVIPYGNEQTPLVTVFDASHRTLFARRYNTLISGVVCSGSYVGVVMYDKVQILSRTNKLIGDITPGETCERCVIVNNFLFALTGTGLHRYHLHLDAEKTEDPAAYVPQVNREQTEPATKAEAATEEILFG